VAKPGTAFVNTLSPHSGAGTNGLSNPLPFIINPPGNPVPTVSSISPTCAVAGSGALTLSAMGSNFLPASDPSGGSQVQWTSALTQTQSTLPIVGTTTASQIQATVSIALLASADTARITVFNPPAPQGGGGGGVSPVGQLFTVQQTAGPCLPPTPAISSNASAMEETPAVSADGRYVAYAAMQNDHAQVFVRDTCEGAAAECQPRTTLLSVTTAGDAANDDSRSPSISADGRYVAFSSAATNLLSDAPQGRQVYLRDTCVGAASSCTSSTQLISTDSNGALVGTESLLPSVSASGRFVAFVAVTPSHAKSSARARATASSPNSGFRQVFVRDTCLGATNCTAKTARISLQPGDAPASGAKPAGAALSSHAKHVALPGVTTATLFTRGVVVDDQVFLALTGQQ
jgi:hypothetical protein